MSDHTNEFVNSLFERYGRELLRFLSSKLGPHEAEDIAQKTYLQLLQHPDPGQIGNPQAYLFRTASNLAIDHVRSRKLGADRAGDMPDWETLAAPGPGPDAAIDAGRRLVCFREALASLPALTRTIFLLSRIDGMTHVELAARFEISEKTVERHVAKALERCNRRLRRLEPDR